MCFTAPAPAFNGWLCTASRLRLREACFKPRGLTFENFDAIQDQPPAICPALRCLPPAPEANLTPLPQCEPAAEAAVAADPLLVARTLTERHKHEVGMALAFELEIERADLFETQPAIKRERASVAGIG